jgi:hypothetical protein
MDAAREIARLSRATPNLKREHEDDFLYVMYLMQRYFLGPDPEDADSTSTHLAEQLHRLERWETVLEGAPDPRLDLCKALENRDADAFQTALIQVAEQRRRQLDTMQSKGTLPDEHAVWAKAVWTEGLALLRLASQDGLGSDFDCPDVPPLLRVSPPFKFDPHAWRNFDFQPASR